MKRNRPDGWGTMAEQIAAHYLRRQGYIIRETNWGPAGSHLEIDLIAERDGVMAFVEVKARSGNWEAPEEAVTDRKIMRIVRAADSYLRRAGGWWEYRFDIITLTGSPADYTLEHLEDAFLPPLEAY